MNVLWIAPLLLAADWAETPAQKIELLKTFREEFVAITPGEGKFPKDFEQGDEALSGEKPKLVVMRQPFAMAKYEVPQNLWLALLGKNPSRWKGPRNSVEMLTYEEANEFCKKVTLALRVTKQIGFDEVVRLPTEAEWEYAARAGTTTRYSFGNDEAELKDYGWYTGNAAGNDPPVGAKQPNPWGLYDMHGYLWEWCQDSAKGDGKTLRVIKSGSWKDKADQLSSGARKLVSEDIKDDAVGLRCVLAKEKKPSEDLLDLIPLGAKPEELYRGGEFTEGPVALADGSILFSDIGNKIMKFDRASGKTTVYRDPSGRSNGLALDAMGRLVACEGANTGGGRRISVTEPDGKVRTLADRYEGKRFNSPNDLAIDRDGNVYFSDPRYVGDDPRDLDFETVFRVTPEGKVTVATRDVQKPNGMAFSPYGDWLYVSDNNPEGNRQLVRFEVAPDGMLTNKKVLHDFGDGRAIDGMKVDVDGNIFATAGTGDKAGLYIFNSEGKLLGVISTPGDPTNCCFGQGEDASILYITTAISHKPTAENGGYGLMRLPTRTRGK